MKNLKKQIDSQVQFYEVKNKFDSERLDIKLTDEFDFIQAIVSLEQIRAKQYYKKYGSDPVFSKPSKK